MYICLLKSSRTLVLMVAIDPLWTVRSLTATVTNIIVYNAIHFFRVFIIFIRIIYIVRLLFNVQSFVHTHFYHHSEHVM